MREEAFVINKWSSWSLRSLMCVYTWSAWKSVWVRAKMVNRHEWIVLFSALLTFAKSVDLINTFSPLETVESIVLNQVLPNRETETKQVLKFNKAKFLKPFVFFFFFPIFPFTEASFTSNFEWKTSVHWPQYFAGHIGYSLQFSLSRL